MNSTGRPRIPFALPSFANSSAERVAWMPYWALLPDSAAGIPILIGPCAHAVLGYIRPPRLAPAPAATAAFRKSRLLMIGPPCVRPDYSRGADSGDFDAYSMYPRHGPFTRRQDRSATEARAPGPDRIRLAHHPLRPASPRGAAGGAARDPDPRGCGRGPPGVVRGELAVPGRAQADPAPLSRERRARQGAARNVAAVPPALPPAFHGGHHARAPRRPGPGRRRGQSGGEDVLAVASGVGSVPGGPAPIARRREVPHHPC